MPHIFYYSDWNAIYGWTLMARIAGRGIWGYTTETIKVYGPDYTSLRVEIDRLTNDK